MNIGRCFRRRDCLQADGRVAAVLIADSRNCNDMTRADQPAIPTDRRAASEVVPRDVSRRTPAGRSVRAWVVLLSFLAIGFAADLTAKQLAFDRVASSPVVLNRETIVSDSSWHPPYHDPIVVIPKVLQFRLVLNRGAVFGVGPGHRWFFIVFTVLAVVVALGVFAFRTGRRQVLIHVSLAFILAGALGNLYDRIRFGAVRDFLNMFPDVNLPFGWHWGSGSPEIFPWVYNLADVFLLCGIGLLMVRMLWGGRRRRGTPADEEPQPA